MNIDNIGKFIKKLREDKGLTQEQLAEIIPISRQAVSKWERGLAIPDSSVLIRLSEIFSVTINEILSGQKITKTNEKEINQISLTLYNETKKKKKIIKILLLILIIIISIFFIYYFIVSYRSIKVYTISGKGKSISFNNGIFISTKEKYYFRIGDFSYNDFNIDSMILYYVDKDGNKNNILYTNEDNIMFIDYYGYDEYIDTSNIENIIKNMFLEINFDDKNEIIKLNFQTDFINDYIFSLKKQNISNSKNKINKQNILNVKKQNLIDKIKENYDLVDGIYKYNFNSNHNIIEIFYDDLTTTLTLNKITNESVQDNWIYQINVNTLIYNDKNGNLVFQYKNDKITCEEKNCEIYNKKLEDFFQYIKSSIN